MEWRQVPGYEGSYEVSDAGDVERCAGYVRSPRATSGQRLKQRHRLRPATVLGYRTVGLCVLGKQKNVKVHTLVAAAFIGPKPAGLCVNHKNGVKGDNRLENLEYVTMAENNQHAYDVLGKRAKLSRGARHSTKGLSNNDIATIRAKRAMGHGLPAIAEEFRISVSSVSNIARRKSWRHV